MFISWFPKLVIKIISHSVWLVSIFLNFSRLRSSKIFGEVIKMKWSILQSYQYKVDVSHSKECRVTNSTVKLYKMVRCHDLVLWIQIFECFSWYQFKFAILCVGSKHHVWDYQVLCILEICFLNWFADTASVFELNEGHVIFHWR